MIPFCSGGTGYCQHNRSAITFENLKTCYTLNEDIVVNYMLHENVQSSTRDWIGIFPRGWRNLQQYLTFEYALEAPRVAPSTKRTILFLRAFHQKASFAVDYQLVYVSKQIQILGTSAYFRFTLPDILEIPKKRAIDKSEMYGGLVGYPPSVVMTDQCFPKPEVAEISMNMYARSMTTTHSGGFPPSVSSKMLPTSSSTGVHSTLGPRRLCPHCHKPEDTANIAARFLASHNDSLIDRVVRLERDLSMAEVAVKHAILVKVNLVNRLQAYEAFVAEMLRSLAVKGMVKITGASGKEIHLQQVNTGTDPLRDRQSSPRPSTSEAQHRERVLKAVIGQQEMTIRQMMEEIKCCQKYRENEFEKSTDCGLRTVDVIPKNFPHSNLLPTKEQCDQLCDSSTAMEKSINFVNNDNIEMPANNNVKAWTQTDAVSINKSSEMASEFFCADLKNLISTGSIPKTHEETTVEPTKDTDTGNITKDSKERFIPMKNVHNGEIIVADLPVDFEQIELGGAKELEGISERTVEITKINSDQTLEEDVMKMEDPLGRVVETLVNEEIQKNTEILQKHQAVHTKPSAIVIKGSNVKFAIIRY